jgi:hypothetical protein
MDGRLIGIPTEELWGDSPTDITYAAFWDTLYTSIGLFCKIPLRVT